MKPRLRRIKAEQSSLGAFAPSDQTWKTEMTFKTAIHMLAVLFWTLSSFPAATTAQQSTPLDLTEENAIRALILQTIRENPEVLVETLMLFQQEVQTEADAKKRAAIKQVRALLELDTNSGVLGNPYGDVVLVEFFDYNCAYCRRAAPVVLELVDENPDLRVIMREWPILGPNSELAARASLASIRQGKFAVFHEALMALPRANAATIRRAADQVGLDFARLEADMQANEIGAHIETSRSLARQLGISGTPSFVIGDTIVPGLIGKADLQALIAEASDGDRAD